MGVIGSCLKELLELSVIQTQMLSEEDIEEFDAIGHKRECIISEIKSRFTSFEELKDEEKKMLLEINARDQQNSVMLSTQIEIVKQQLKQLNDYNRRDKKYIDQYPDLGSGRYFDK